MTIFVNKKLLQSVSQILNKSRHQVSMQIILPYFAKKVVCVLLILIVQY